MHRRARHILAIFKKRARIWPVLGLLGPRQVGKSTFLKEQWSTPHRAEYLTLDRKETREQAERAPEHLLRSQTENLTKNLIIDEAQKAPALFDGIKLVVDERRKNGLLTLSGSSEFSRRTGIRESLTGRIGIMRLYPLTVRELAGRSFEAHWLGMSNSKMKPPDQVALEKQLAIWIERGGMPGICMLRERDERANVIEQWLDTTCGRDLLGLRGARLNGELAKDILQFYATSEESTIQAAAKKLRRDPRIVRNHTEALEALFVLNRLDAHPAGTGKPRYHLFDSGIAAFLGASPTERQRILLLNECLAQHEYAGAARPRLTYFQSRRRSEIDLIVSTRDSAVAIILSDEAAPGSFVERTLRNFRGKELGAKLVVLAPVSAGYKLSTDISVLPRARMV